MSDRGAYIADPAHNNCHGALVQIPSMPERGRPRLIFDHGHVAAGSKLMMRDAGCSGIRGRRYGLSDALWQE